MESSEVHFLHVLNWNVKGRPSVPKRISLDFLPLVDKPTSISVGVSQWGVLVSARAGCQRIFSGNPSKYSDITCPRDSY